MRSFSFILLAVFALFTAGAAAEVPDEEEIYMLDNIRKMRIKQQGEENVVRVQQFINQQSERHCTPVQQARQRLADMEAEREGTTATEDVHITAGHGELNVTSNEGTINSDINVQIIKNGDEEECL